MRELNVPNETFIYCLLDPNGDVKYIGKSDNPNKRYNEHLRRSKQSKTYKDRWINGLLSISQKPELLILDKIQFKDWAFWEIFYISLFKTWGFKLTNLTIGGDGGNFGNEVNKKISDKLTGRIFSDEWRENIRKGKTGKSATDETKLKFSLIRTGSGNPMYGKKRKKEWDDNKKKKILQLRLNGEVINEWLSIQSAVNETKINRTSINSVLKHKRNHAGGYKWEYLNIY
jgi:group I intron endonuclease